MYTHPTLTATSITKAMACLENHFPAFRTTPAHATPAAPTSTTQNSHETIIIAGHEVAVARDMQSGEGYFSPRSVCDALGIAWQRQHEKIKQDAVLDSVVTLMVTTARDGKNYQTLMLPISMASGWLFTIKRVRPELQAKLTLFRTEGYLALDAWFRQGLRNQLTPGHDFIIPKTLTEALRLALQQAEELEEAKVVNSQQAHALAVTTPKAEVYDNVLAHNLIDLYTFSRTLFGVNSLGVKPALADLKYIYRGPVMPTLENGKGGKGATYRVYATYREDFFIEKFDQLYGSYKIYLTDEGKQLLVSLYKQGLLPMKRGYEYAWCDLEEGTF